MRKQNPTLLIIAGLVGAVGWLLWRQDRQAKAPTVKDVEQSAKKTTNQARALEDQAVALEKQANNTAEMAARNAYQRAQAQLAFDQAAAGAARYAAGGIAYPQFAPSRASQIIQVPVPMSGGGHL